MRKFAWIVPALAAISCNLLAVSTAMPLPAETITPITLSSQITVRSTSNSQPATPQQEATEAIGPTQTPVLTRTPAPTETPIPTLEMPYSDVSGFLQGVCFKYLAGLDKQSLAFSSTGDLAAFFDAANKSKKCSKLIDRPAFDFSTKQIIGTVITAQGCGIVLHYDRTDQDDKKQERTIIFEATTTGDCPYALVEPILVAVDLPAGGFKWQLAVTKASP